MGINVYDTTYKLTELITGAGRLMRLYVCADMIITIIGTLITNNYNKTT